MQMSHLAATDLHIAGHVPDVDSHFFLGHVIILLAAYENILAYAGLEYNTREKPHTLLDNRQTSAREDLPGAHPGEDVPLRRFPDT